MVSVRQRLGIMAAYEQDRYQEPKQMMQTRREKAKERQLNRDIAKLKYAFWIFCLGMVSMLVLN